MKSQQSNLNKSFTAGAALPVTMRALVVSVIKPRPPLSIRPLSGSLFAELDMKGEVMSKESIRLKLQGQTKVRKSWRERDYEQVKQEAADKVADWILDKKTLGYFKGKAEAIARAWSDSKKKHRPKIEYKKTDEGEVVPVRVWEGADEYVPIISALFPKYTEQGPKIKPIKKAKALRDYYAILIYLHDQLAGDGIRIADWTDDSGKKKIYRKNVA